MIPKPNSAFITDRSEKINRPVVNAQQMREIENRMFAAGIPVAALMEKVGQLLVQKIIDIYPRSRFPKMGILAGTGHNGGDALVIARELYLQGYQLSIYQPSGKAKELTANHAKYASSLGMSFSPSVESLNDCDVIIDGLFGVGLERSLQGEIFSAIDTVNSWHKLVVSIDLPSGLHTDTGEVMGTAIRATQTFCLGLWKQGLLHDRALEFTGEMQLVDFGILWADITAVLSESLLVENITDRIAIMSLPLPRPLVTHKYKTGRLLLICGSQKYSGAAILSTLGAQSSGVGMLSVAVPQSLQSLLTAQSPGSLIIGCPEIEDGAIAQLPDTINLENFDAIACGPGLTTTPQNLVRQLISTPIPLILDADGLNILANLSLVEELGDRQALTILTPHVGEFKRLFPHLFPQIERRLDVCREASQYSGAIVVLKGAITAIASPNGKVWLNSKSTPALARGGSGDVLTGLMGGLLAQGISRQTPIESIVASAVWWHSQAGRYAVSARTELGVDAFTLAQSLIPCLQSFFC